MLLAKPRHRSFEHLLIDTHDGRPVYNDLQVKLQCEPIKKHDRQCCVVDRHRTVLLVKCPTVFNEKFASPDQSRLVFPEYPAPFFEVVTVADLKWPLVSRIQPND
jgi:hypothetical protein